MANTNNANPNVAAGSDDDLGNVFSKSFIDAIVTGFGKGMGAAALLLLVGLPLVVGGLVSTQALGIENATIPGFDGFVRGAMIGSAGGINLLARGPGLAMLGAGGLAGSYLSWVNNKQATAVANIAQQNAEMKSQLEDYHQQNVTVQVDQQPGRAGWNRKQSERVVEVQPSWVAQEEARRTEAAINPNAQGVYRG